MPELWQHREELIRAALSYVASEKGDENSAYYDAELEMKEEQLKTAARSYVLAMKGGG